MNPAKRFKFKYIPHAVILGDEGIVRWSGNLYIYSIEKGLEKLLGPVHQPHAENIISSEDLDPLILHTEKQCKMVPAIYTDRRLNTIQTSPGLYTGVEKRV